MTKSPHDQQKTDAARIGHGGTGKLDQRQAPATPEPIHHESLDEPGSVGSPQDAAFVGSIRGRLESDREAAIGQLRTLGLSPDTDDTPPRAGTDVALDEGDEAQANERQDMNFMTRQRLAERINRLTAALERIQQGRYGTCAICGGPIEPARLAAAPESEMCLKCQEARERGATEAAA
jgi:DnaK suppressor protein